jgi:hypothetical protein
MWNLTSFSLQIVLLSVQERCSVCAKHTIRSKIALDAPDGTLRWWGSSESSVRLDIVLILRQDRNRVCVERIIGSKIVLDAPDGTPRWRGSNESSVHLEIVLILTQNRPHFASNVLLALKSFWSHPMELLGDVGHVESRFFPFGDSVSVGAT